MNNEKKPILPWNFSILAIIGGLFGFGATFTLILITLKRMRHDKQYERMLYFGAPIFVLLSFIFYFLSDVNTLLQRIFSLCALAIFYYLYFKPWLNNGQKTQINIDIIFWAMVGFILQVGVFTILALLENIFFGVPV